MQGDKAKRYDCQSDLPYLIPEPVHRCQAADGVGGFVYRFDTAKGQTITVGRPC